jgi:hypothetical protein
MSVMALDPDCRRICSPPLIVTFSFTVVVWLSSKFSVTAFATCTVAVPVCTSSEWLPVWMVSDVLPLIVSVCVPAFTSIFRFPLTTVCVSSCSTTVSMSYCA